MTLSLLPIEPPAVHAVSSEEIQAVLRDAELLFSFSDVEAALDRMALAISQRLRESNPLVLVVLRGALITAGHLLTRLHFPLQFDYLHATRYRGATRGADLRWIVRPVTPVAGRTVLVVDDIFDEGHTLKAIVDELRASGAGEVYSAVLVSKRHDHKVPGLTMDFVGLEVEDRYVFGFGMDYKDALRNLPGIYAVKDGA